MVKSEVGEDEIVFCSGCDYAANMEKAESVDTTLPKEEMRELNPVHTPGVHTIAELEEFFNCDAKKFAKTLIYEADGKTVVVLVRGDREVNETKVVNAIGGAVEFELAREEVVKRLTNAEVGFAGPIGIQADYILVDREVANQSNVGVGGNKTDYHIQNANYGRDFDGVVGDFRNVTETDKCIKCGSSLEIARGVEVGHIFKLGTKYSEAMGCNFIDKDGKSKPVVMGCYGIGVERTAAAIIEQHHDENGIKWPLSVAPYHAVVVPVNIKKEEQIEASEKIYAQLQDMGVEVLLDDRDERVGVKFKDSELIGIPMRITVGKDITDGKVEFKLRNADEKELIALDEIEDRIKAEFVKNNVKLAGR
jgi:prolyl-tRNA synthetase